MEETSARGSILTNGLEKLLDTGGVAVDRMPMLHVIFDRMAAQCSEYLRQFSSTPAFLTVAEVSTERIGDVLDAYDGNAIVAITYVQAWDSRVLIGLDRNFIFNLVEVLFGGDGGEAPITEKRDLSAIEVRLSQLIFELICKALRASFATVCETTFKVERTETRLDFAVIAPRNTFGVSAIINLRIQGRNAGMFILIPQAALNSIRQQLGRDLSNDMSLRDPDWTKQIEGEIGRTEVAVRGVIEERHFALEDIARLRVGQILTLQATTKTRVKLECNAEPLFWCNLGQADGLYTLRVDDFVNQEQEFINDVLPR
jgi:flagellar motor switch protein FliM